MHRAKLFLGPIALTAMAQAQIATLAGGSASIVRNGQAVAGPAIYAGDLVEGTAIVRMEGFQLRLANARAGFKPGLVRLVRGAIGVEGTAGVQVDTGSAVVRPTAAPFSYDLSISVLQVSRLTVRSGAVAVQPANPNWGRQPAVGPGQSMAWTLEAIEDANAANPRGPAIPEPAVSSPAPQVPPPSGPTPSIPPPQVPPPSAVPVMSGSFNFGLLLGMAEIGAYVRGDRAIISGYLQKARAEAAQAGYDVYPVDVMIKSAAAADHGTVYQTIVHNRLAYERALARSTCQCSAGGAPQTLASVFALGGQIGFLEVGLFRNASALELRNVATVAASNPAAASVATAHRAFQAVLARILRQGETGAAVYQALAAAREEYVRHFTAATCRC